MSKYKCPGLIGHGRDSGLGSTPCSLFSSKSDWNRTAYKRVNYNAAVAIGQFHSTQILSLLPKHSFRDSVQVGPQVNTTSWLIMPKCVHTWATLGPHWGTEVCTHLHLMWINYAFICCLCVCVSYMMIQWSKLHKTIIRGVNYLAIFYIVHTYTTRTW